MLLGTVTSLHLGIQTSIQLLPPLCPKLLVYFPFYLFFIRFRFRLTLVAHNRMPQSLYDKPQGAAGSTCSLNHVCSCIFIKETEGGLPRLMFTYHLMLRSLFFFVSPCGVSLPAQAHCFCFGCVDGEAQWEPSSASYKYPDPMGCLVRLSSAMCVLSHCTPDLKGSRSVFVSGILMRWLSTQRVTRCRPWAGVDGFSFRRCKPSFGEMFVWCDIAASGSARGGWGACKGWPRARHRRTLLDKRYTLQATSSVWSQLCLSYLIPALRGRFTPCMKKKS